MTSHGHLSDRFGLRAVPGLAHPPQLRTGSRETSPTPRAIAIADRGSAGSASPSSRPNQTGRQLRIRPTYTGRQVCWVSSSTVTIPSGAFKLWRLDGLDHVGDLVGLGLDDGLCPELDAVVRRLDHVTGDAVCGRTRA